MAGGLYWHSPPAFIQRMTPPPARRPGSGTYVNLLSGLTVMAAVGLALVFGLMFLGPGLVPDFLAFRTPTLAPLVTLSAPPPTPFVFPTALPAYPDSPFIQTAAVATATPAVIEVNPTNPAVAGGITVNAQVSGEGSGLRLRESPGTAGGVMAFLDSFTQLVIIGRPAASARG